MCGWKGLRSEGGRHDVEGTGHVNLAECKNRGGVGGGGGLVGGVGGTLTPWVGYIYNYPPVLCGWTGLRSEGGGHDVGGTGPRQPCRVQEPGGRGGGGMGGATLTPGVGYIQFSTCVVVDGQGPS